MGVDVSLDGRVVEINMSHAWAWSQNAGPEVRETPGGNRAGPRRAASRRVTRDLGSWMTWAKGVRNR